MQINWQIYRTHQIEWHINNDAAEYNIKWTTTSCNFGCKMDVKDSKNTLQKSLNKMLFKYQNRGWLPGLLHHILCSRTQTVCVQHEHQHSHILSEEETGILCHVPNDAKISYSGFLVHSDSLVAMAKSTKQNDNLIHSQYHAVYQN